VVTVWKSAICGIDVRDKFLDQPLAKARSRRQVPVAVIRKDNDEWHRFPRKDHLIRRLSSPNTDPLIVCVGLSMQEIKHRVALLGLFIVAGRQIDAELLWRSG
jgi:hypothetical protein